MHFACRSILFFAYPRQQGGKEKKKRIKPARRDKNNVKNNPKFAKESRPEMTP
jgi:hypothetical protein